MTQDNKMDTPPIYLLPAPPSKDDIKVEEESLPSTALSWDERILFGVFRGKPRTEIARITGRSTSYIRKIEQLPEFQKELAQLRGIVIGDFVEKTGESLKSAKEMRHEALKQLHTELMDVESSPQGRIASAKVLLDEAHREEMQNRGERDRPLSLNEVRRMSVAEAQDLAKEHQIRRSK
jgi:hypothetical protein